MSRFNAKNINWEKVEVQGKECLFSEMRIDRKTVPEGYTMYEVRHADEDWGEPVELALGIMINFFGTLLTTESFELEPFGATTNAYLWLEEGDWCYLDEYVHF